MTLLSDLPSELLLLISAELNNGDRRRFSKVCRRNYHLIRKPRNISKFTIRSERSINICVEQFGENACVVQGQDTGKPIPFAVRCVVITHNYTELPARMWDLVNTSRIPYDQISWNRCHNIFHKSLEIIHEWTRYMNVETMTYGAHFRVFNPQFARTFSLMVKTCHFHIFTDGTFTERAERLYDRLFANYLKNAHILSDTKSSHSEYITITETFNQQYQTPDEIDRLHDSNRRIMKRIRQLYAADDAVVYTVRTPDLWKRVMWSTLGQDGKVYDGMDLFRPSHHTERKTREEQMKRKIRFNLEGNCNLLFLQDSSDSP